MMRLYFICLITIAIFAACTSAKKSGSTQNLSLPSIDSFRTVDLFFLTFRFIYCGKIDLAQLQGPDVLKLLIAVDELNIQTLIHHIQEYLIKYQGVFLQQNP